MKNSNELLSDSDKKSVLEPDDSLESLGVHMFFNDVDSESARDVCEFIIKSNYTFKKSEPITIFVNSQGGSVYDGFSIIDLMETSRIPIQTVGIGMIASMASLIVCTGTPGMRIMSNNAFIMTHQFSGYTEGKYHELVAARRHDDHLHKRFIKHFLKHTTMSEKQIKDVFLASSDKWITAKEALKYGLCDKVKNPWN